jgi:hypothetical protein
VRSSDRWFDPRTILCVLCTVVTVLVVAPTVLDTSSRTNDAADSASAAKSAADSARRVADLAKSIADAIQAQRVDSIRSACKAQNRRHDQTIRALDHLIAQIPPGPRRVRAKANRAGTVFLLEAIVPHQDCEALVRRAAPRPRP